MSNRAKITVWLIATSLPLGLLLTIVIAWGAAMSPLAGLPWLRSAGPPDTSRSEEIATGWPMRSLHMWAAPTGRDHYYRGFTDEVRYHQGVKVHLLPLDPDSYEVLPLRPMWLGFAVDVLCYASAIAVHLLVFAIVPPRLWRKERCTECRYDLSHIESTRCPECGTPRGRRWWMYKPIWAWRSAFGIILAYGMLIGIVIVGTARVEHWSSIHQAAKFGDLDRLRAELAAGVDVDLPLDISASFFRNATPLHIAAVTSQLEAAQLLITAGADINAPLLINGWRPIDLAIHVGGVEMLSLLLNAGADASPNPAVRSTPMELALRRGGHGVTRLLLSRQDDPAAAAQHLLRLWCAERWGITDQAMIGQTLVEFGADVHGTMLDGTPLMLEAARCIDPFVLGFFIEQGVDVNLRDDDDRTALMYASLAGSYEAVHALLEAGADASLRDGDEQTALDLTRHALENDEDVNPDVFVVIKVLEHHAQQGTPD
ncbi:MAG: ankyrin repeat domain-containing protein [Phycisphaerales bacterium]|nr:ankyrin repeat domain-containing protein [Phycisphaerales bacterium]